MRHNNRCKRCGEFLGNGLYKSFSHKCRVKAVIPKFTRQTIEEIFGSFKPESKPQEIKLMMGLNSYNLIKDTWQKILSPAPV